MTQRQVDELIWEAFMNPDVCQQLLAGQERRSKLLKNLGFSEDARRMVLGVQAENLEGFALALSNQGTFPVC
jgi:adenylylsulfate kinase-like enzyme